MWGPSFSRSCKFQGCDLVPHFPGIANSRGAIWSVIFQVLQIPGVRFGPSFSRSCNCQGCDLVRHFPGLAFSSHCFLWSVIFRSCKFSAPHQALHWQVPGFKRGPGRPRTNWRSSVNKDLLRMEITWAEAEVAVQKRLEWRRSVAQCIHLNVGWIKVKVKVKRLIGV